MTVSSDPVVNQLAIQLIRVLASKARQRSTELTIERKVLGLGRFGFVTLHIGSYGDLHYVDPSSRSSTPRSVDLDQLEPAALLQLALELA